ncbi:hypothetical protein [Hymenobacter weizhouensis]|uniref:hypothetical protein n=1 Tax=Hymenobacter sp. YIM 151500-1 TaxID=2987689 RepID=UPI002227C0F0|nr:hypothetical protein [Hymenobacter sp. YIM 151500-1]UYZ62564.1 hypothetical protein OIS53_16380 [Hymenobacter sp. YIM 151500-1]
MRLALPTACAGLLLTGLLAACGPASTSSPDTVAALPAPPLDTAAYPMAEGFNQAGSDARALHLADRVMRQMGGYPAWQQTRLLGWSFLDGSYQLWDKYTGDFRWQKDSLVAVYNLDSQEGRAYRAGQDISGTQEGRQLLADMYPTWVNNSWWLVMPFKLKDAGVTLTYKGTGKFMDGTPAEVLSMTFQKVGVTPENRYDIFINPRTNLVEEWSFYRNAQDAQPAFHRRWADYRRTGRLLLASDRTDGKDGRRLTHVVALDSVPASVMQSPRPIQPL